LVGKKVEVKYLSLIVLLILLLVGCSQHRSKSGTKVPLQTEKKGKGKIKKTPNQELYKPGTEVELTAEGQKEDNWQLAGWAGSLDGTEKKKIVVVKEGLKVVAEFVDLPEFDLEEKSAADDASKKTIIGEITEKGGKIKQATINWGDGNTDELDGNLTEIEKTHDYNSGGEYTITVQAANQEGNTGKWTKQVKVPIPEIDVNKKIENNKVVLTGKITGEVGTVKIKWGDDNTETLNKQEFNQQQVQHEYSQADKYPLTILAKKDKQIKSRREAVINLSDCLVAPELSSPANGQKFHTNNQTKDIILDWLKNKSEEKTNDLKYDVYVWSSKQTPQKRKTVSDTQCTIKNLACGKDYNWKVKVKDDNRQNESESWSFKIVKNDFPTAPELISPVEETVTKEDITLKWAESENKEGTELKYDVYFWDATAEKQKVAADLTETSYQLTEIEKDMSCKWQVIAKDEKGATAESKIAIFQVIQPLRINN